MNYFNLNIFVLILIFIANNMKKIIKKRSTLSIRKQCITAIEKRHLVTQSSSVYYFIVDVKNVEGKRFKM